MQPKVIKGEYTDVHNDNKPDYVFFFFFREGHVFTMPLKELKAVTESGLNVKSIYFSCELLIFLLNFEKDEEGQHMQN